jgi:hypothetical protein
MRRTQTGTIAGLVTALLSGAVGISAAGASDSDVDFAVQAGDLTASQAAVTPVTLSAQGGLVTGSSGTVAGRLHTITVNDSRGGLTTNSWQVNVSWTDFRTGDSTGSDNGTIAQTAGRAYLAAADELANLAGSLLDITSGTKATAQAGELAPVTFDGTAYSGAIVEGGTFGNGSLDFTPSFAVDVPADAAPGTYSGTVTFTVVP